MNPLVEQMLNATVSNDVDTRLLEDLFERDCECESPTHDKNRVICSGEATWALKSCQMEIRVCEAMGQHVNRGISKGAKCAHCKNFLSECWTIRPI